MIRSLTYMTTVIVVATLPPSLHIVCNWKVSTKAKEHLISNRVTNIFRCKKKRKEKTIAIVNVSSCRLWIIPDFFFLSFFFFKMKLHSNTHIQNKSVGKWCFERALSNFSNSFLRWFSACSNKMFNCTNVWHESSCASSIKKIDTM